MTMDEEKSMIEVFHERCIGAGNCSDVAGRYFDQSDDDGTVVRLRDAVESGDEDMVEEAVNVCPTGALAFHLREVAGRPD